MSSALELLRQGTGEIKPTSALDLLRTGLTEPVDFSVGITGLQTPTQNFIFPSQEPKTATDLVAKKEISPKAEQFRQEAEEAKKIAEKSFIPQSFKEIAQSMGQSIARSFLAVGQTISDIPKIVSRIADKPEGTLFQDIKKAIKESEFIPETKFETALAGTIEPVSFESIGKETLSIFGEDFTKKHENLAFPVGLLMAGLDVTQFGGTKKGAFQALKSANNVGDAILVLKKMGIADDLARQFADDVVKVADDKAAKILFENIANIQRTTKTALQAIPEISPKISPIQKLINAIDEAVPLRGEQKKLYQEELAKRTARVAAVGEKVGGEKGFFAQLGQLKGELPKVQFESIRKQFSQTDVDSLFDTIEQTKTLLPLEKVSTKEGLRKLFEGAVPTPSEIEHLREVFPKELIDSVLARRPLLEKVKDAAGELWNLPRSIMATADLSAPFRQGVFMLGRPKRFAEAFTDMFKFAGSEKAYQGFLEGVKASPDYLKMKQGRLALTDIGGSLLKREERFMSNLAEKIPLFGSLARASNRAYTGFLNKLRVDVFNDILGKAEVMGRKIDEPLLKSIGDFINAGTGRGKFGLLETGIIPKSMEKAAIVLNGVFFSPRLMASRLNLLNPYFYVQLDPLVRKEAIKTLFATSGILGSMYGLWKLNGGNVGIDPRSADFGKLKIGNTRYDILGGFQQYVKLASQLITGEIVSSTTGRTITLGEGFKPLTRKDIILRFFESKESPIASFLTGWLTQQTATGQEFDVPTEVINRFIPMVVQDLYDIAQDKGSEGLLMGIPAIFGVGVQTYGKQELVTGKSKIGEETLQIRPVPELGEKIRELVLGQLPLGTSKSFSVETYFDQMNNLSREEAANVFDEIAKTNPELAEKLSKVVKERELGITVKDKDLKAKGVASGERALAIKAGLDNLKTKEEKAILWEDYVKKGVITKEVSRQLEKILK